MVTFPPIPLPLTAPQEHRRNKLPLQRQQESLYIISSFLFQDNNIGVVGFEASIS